MTFSFIDLFSGIGGFRIALEQLGGKCIAFSEIDKNALNTYKQNFNTLEEIELGDITKVKKLPYADLIVGGVPCQAWSIAGKNLGFDDDRGKLWFDAIQTVKKVKPKAFIFENVKGLQDPRNLSALNLIISELSKLNYKVKYQVLNATDFGLPQNRERLFIVGIRKDIKDDFIFPKVSNQRKTILDILIDKTKNSNKNYYEGVEFFTFCDTRNGDTTIHSWDITECSESEKNICLLILNNRRKSKYGDKDGNPLSYEDLKILDNSITKKDIESLLKKKILKKVGSKFELTNSKNSSGINNIYRIYLPNSYHFATLTATGNKDFISTDFLIKKSGDIKKDFIDQIFNQKKYRKLSVKETLKMQGFPENFKTHEKDSVILKQLGNAVPTNVVYAVASQLKKILK